MYQTASVHDNGVNISGGVAFKMHFSASLQATIVSSKKNQPRRETLALPFATPLFRTTAHSRQSNFVNAWHEMTTEKQSR
ncbi:protein of unknown function [Pararobbsia alpina]